MVSTKATTTFSRHSIKVNLYVSLIKSSVIKLCINFCSQYLLYFLHAKKIGDGIVIIIWYS